MASKKAAGAAAAIAAAVALAAPITEHFEGLRTRPYRDPVGIVSVCYGETAVPMREYGAAECSAMLKARATRDFAPLVLAAVPGLAGKPHAFAASIDFAYNVGTFNNTSMARAFRAGQWAKGCDAFRLYRFARRGGDLVELPGLVRRREAERALCMKDAA